MGHRNQYETCDNGCGALLTQQAYHKYGGRCLSCNQPLGLKLHKALRR